MEAAVSQHPAMTMRATRNSSPTSTTTTRTTNRYRIDSSLKRNWSLRILPRVDIYPLKNFVLRTLFFSPFRLFSINSPAPGRKANSLGSTSSHDFPIIYKFQIIRSRIIVSSLSIRYSQHKTDEKIPPFFFRYSKTKIKSRHWIKICFN